MIKNGNYEIESLLLEKVNFLLSNLKLENSIKRMTIDTVADTYVLNISDVLYCESDINYTYIYTIKGSKIISSKTLKTYENLLQEYGFYRVHQSYLINLNYVIKYTKGKPSYAILNDGSRIIVSLRNRAGFLKRLKELY